jgi:predicted nuclease of predicted toxin-antitoxin system
MSLLFDQNLSPFLVGLLAGSYPGCAHVRDFGLAESDDEDIWQCAAARGLAIVSKDADFQHRALLYGPPPKVIWVRIGNGPTSSVVRLLTEREPEVTAFLADEVAALLVLP